MFSSCSKQQQQQQAGAPEIATMTVALGNSEVESSYPAQIKGKTDIDIRPQVTGFITKVHVDEGQRVSKGQVLFTLDQVQFQAAVDQASAAVRSAQTAVNMLVLLLLPASSPDAAAPLPRHGQRQLDMKDTCRILHDN